VAACLRPFSRRFIKFTCTPAIAAEELANWCCWRVRSGRSAVSALVRRFQMVSRRAELPAAHAANTLKHVAASSDGHHHSVVLQQSQNRRLMSAGHVSRDA